MSEEVDLPVTARSRRFGYLIWPRRLDAEVSALLGKRDTCDVVFDGNDLGTKRVDWKRRRISVGPARTRGMDPRVVAYRLHSLGSSGAVSVVLVSG